MDISDLFVYLSEKTVKCVLIYTIFFFSQGISSDGGIQEIPKNTALIIVQ